MDINTKNAGTPGESKIPHLDQMVINALDSFASWNYPDKNVISSSEKNIFIGSGSAACAAEMFARKFGGISLNASRYIGFFKRTTSRDFNVYVVSASGGKDSIPMAKFFQGISLPAILITCNDQAPAKEYCKDIIVFPAHKEPPTYNTSTYGSMLYWLDGGNPEQIKENILAIKDIPSLRGKHVVFMAQDEYDVLADMGERKVLETLQNTPSNGEGFTHGSHGLLRQPNENRIVIRLNDTHDYQDEIYDILATTPLEMMMKIYYIIGKNQNDQDAQNIAKDYKETIAKLGWTINQVN